MARAGTLTWASAIDLAQLLSNDATDMPQPTSEWYTAPDGAVITPKHAVYQYLSKPEYINFMPGCGVLLVDAVRGLLVRIDRDELCYGPISLQLTADKDALARRSLSPDELGELAVAAELLWTYRGPEDPGAGILFLVDRGMIRRIAFNLPIPRPVKILRELAYGV